MKRWIIFSITVWLFACNGEDTPDCFQTTGNIIVEEFVVGNFTKVRIEDDVSLVIRQGAQRQVLVETGENLVSDIDIKLNGDQLQLTDNNTCNLVRDYGITKVYVTAPDLSEIRNSSQYEVRSENTIGYENLVLTSEDFNEPGSFTVGDFRMDLNCERVQVVSNNLSSFYLSGTVNQLNVGFFSGDGRFEGEQLEAQNVQFFHRGSNDIIVNPIQSLSGEIRSTGDLISVNVPPTVDVQEFYTGQLIFQD